MYNNSAVNFLLRMAGGRYADKPQGILFLVLCIALLGAIFITPAVFAQSTYTVDLKASSDSGVSDSGRYHQGN